MRNAREIDVRGEIGFARRGKRIDLLVLIVVGIAVIAAHFPNIAQHVMQAKGVRLQ